MRIKVVDKSSVGDLIPLTINGTVVNPYSDNDDEDEAKADNWRDYCADGEFGYEPNFQ